MNARDFLDLQDAYQGVYQELDELWKGKHGQSEKEYQAGRSDAGKRISGDENTGPNYYTKGRARGAKPDAPTAPGAKPVNTPKLSRDEKEYHQYNKSGAKRRSEYNKVGGSKGLPEEVDTFDAILEYLVAEGYADTNENAIAIMANMSEEWRESIVEAASDQSDKQIDKGVKSTYKAQNVLDNQHQGRSKGLNKLPRGEREEKAKRMSGRLKNRRDDLFGERNKREDEKMSELKKKLGL
jgi:hypothetical protein